MKTRLCPKCQKEKLIEDFHKGNTSWCKFCKKEYDEIYRKQEKTQTLYKSKEYRDRKGEYRKKLASTNPAKIMHTTAKHRAKKQNIPFTISVEDIIIPEYCPILNIKLERKEYGKKGTFIPESPSLDKIIPELGYTKENIIVISMKANTMKSNASLEELELFSRNILKIIEKIKNNGNNNRNTVN